MTQATSWQVPTSATDANILTGAALDRIDNMADAIVSSHSGATRPTYAVAGTVWLDTSDDQLYLYDGAADIRLVQELDTAPTTADAAGKSGDQAYASGFFYKCVATDEWQRVALATWA